ncbi:glycosyltransferase [Luteolibacter flavescens]|uniref:Glycosyltransferase n=1 Tax=Luteolibacter flavescens TaxID=1859460 RepID=A0ABT3FTP5_9BACT|nr:glycosyltransferase [Luteolibacter flavescens]MCW1886360.1 glycosyltransferase [Luteolibacter flavescens]
MRKVLFIAYHFPPSGGGGVQRSLKFVKYLPEAGYLPIVLTTEAPDGRRWTPKDQALMDEVPPEVQIHRVAIPDEVHVPGKLERAARELLGLRSRFGRTWMEQVIEAGTRIAAQQKPDLIFVTMSPFDGADAAAEISRRTGIPWVADLRDPWALDEFQLHRTGLHREMEKAQMQRSLESAALVIMNTPESARRVKETMPRIAPERVVSLTNGYDAEDFSGDAPPIGGGRFNIVHSGYFHAEQGLTERSRQRQYRLLGRTIPGVERLSRSHYYLLQAMEKWLAEAPDIASEVRMHCVGVLSRSDQALIDASPAKELFACSGYLSHAECLHYVRGADLLFLPMHKMPEGMKAGLVPGKTYEYMAAGRPVLATLPASDARDFLEYAGTGVFCDPGDVNGLLAELKDQHAKWKSGQQSCDWNAEFVRQFERKNLTADLAEFFDQVR